MTMDREASTLPSLIGEVLATLVASEAPSTDLVARLVTRIRQAPAAEIQLGLHSLWPFTRHISQREWLKTLCFQLAKIPSAPPLRGDAQQWIRQWGIERDAQMPGILEKFEQMAPMVRDRFRRDQETEAAVGKVSGILTPGDTVIANPVTANQGPSAVAESRDARQDPVDPLARHLPPIDDYGDESFWYQDETLFGDYLPSACVVLVTIATEVRTRVHDESLFWGVLGRIHEPFALGDPDELEDKIESAESEVLAARIRDGQADLLDYMDYFEEFRGFGDDFLESEYESFLAAVERASPAECEALFPKLMRLEYGPDLRPPRPAEEHLPIADRLWATILAKRDLSVTLFARGGLFYWLCREPARAPTLALVALGRVCEGDCLEFWRVPPFLPFWAAAQRAAEVRDWDFAAVYWKRALVDIAMFAQELNSDERGEQLHRFPFDPRLVRDIYTHFGDRPLEQQLLVLALTFAVRALQESSLDEWSQLHFVLLELSRRLGIKVVDEQHLKAILGEDLCGQIGTETKRLLGEAEATWVLAEQQLDRDPDLAGIGWNYRRAIETEWRLKVGPTLAELDAKINPKRPGISKMLSVLRQLNSQPLQRQLLRRRLAGVVRSNSRLFDELFLKRALDLVDNYLHEGTHVRLDRKQCRSLRARLLDDRMLHDLLASVQPPDEA